MKSALTLAIAIAGLSAWADPMAPTMAVPNPTFPLPLPAPSPNERDFKAVWAIFREQPPDPKMPTAHPREYFQWLGLKFQRFAQAAQAFAAEYPHDPRRWEGIIQSGFTRPLFITGFKEGFDAHPSAEGLIEDVRSVDVFIARETELCRAAVQSQDANSRQRLGAYGWLAGNALVRFRVAQSPANKAAYMAVIAEMTSRYPSSAALIARQHLAFLTAYGTKGELDAFRAKLSETREPKAAQPVSP